MPRLVLGPLLRYVSDTQASVWVETDGPCEVTVLGQGSRTFEVAGHHFALVVLSGLEPGSTLPYTVELDGSSAWPEPGDPFPHPVLRTHGPDGPNQPIRLAFGSCRVSVPHDHPYSLPKDKDARGREVDALWALVRRMEHQDPEEWPDALLLLGDQVYADEVSPDTQREMCARRDPDDPDLPPEDDVADFEDYTALYRESWSDPALRWLLSVVSSSMIFDDHDVHDDWNTSETWVAQMHATPWWRKRIDGAYASYWIYQHIGNVAPDSLHDDPVHGQVMAEEGDCWWLLENMAREAERRTDQTRWSFRRDLGRTRVVIVDSRAGRILREGEREMLSDADWAWVEEQVSGDYDHLVIGTSLPYVLAPALHHLEAWNEAVCGGAWGTWAARQGEKVRQGLDLEHWAAFQRSFHRMAALLAEVAAGRRGGSPASVVLLSGDVHHAYLAELKLPALGNEDARVLQAVCSPVRNPLNRRERTALRGAFTRPVAAFARALARSAGVDDPPLRWAFAAPPAFDNQIASLTLSGDDVTVRIERTMPEDWRAPELHEGLSMTLHPRRAAAGGAAR